MNPEEVIRWLEAKASKNFSKLQESILQGSWEDRTYGEIAQSTGYHEDHVKDVGSQLWRQLSEILKTEITKKTFKIAIVSLLTSISSHDWGDAPDLPSFFGRSTEIDMLKQWILLDKCKFVAIVGIAGIGKTQLSVKLGKGGIGKTDLSLKLARGIQEHFEYLIWRRLLNAPSLSEIITDLIKVLSNQQEITIPEGVNAQILRLLHYLKQHRCLIILDNVETILQGGTRAGYYRQGYEGYGQLFKTVAEVSHQSCLLLTSREKPQNLERFEGKNKSVRFLKLSGLEITEGQEIFNDLEDGNFFGSEAQWKELIEFYNGNPLALELVACHIQEVFNGDISQFLREGKPIFDDLHDLLDQHWQRLSKEEREIFYWFAIDREPLSILGLKEDVLSLEAKERVPDALQSLQRRLPLEKSVTGFTLQPVLIEYATEILIEQICAEIKFEDMDLLNSHALLKALAKTYIRETQIRLIVQPILNKLIEHFGSKTKLENRFQQILGQIREKTGYGAGNILNLLCQLNTDLRGYDFSHQTIRQAYLQGKNLAEVNFAHSIFTQTVFTQSFGGVHSIAFSPDGQLLAMGDSQGEIRLLRVADDQQILRLTGHGTTMWVTSIAFSQDSQYLISSSFDRTVRLWDLNTGECLKVFQGHNNWIWTVAFSPDGKTVASGSDDCMVKLWDIGTGECLKTLTEHTNWVWSIAFSPDGRTLASGSYDCTIRLWDVSTGQCLKIFQGHDNSVWSVRFSSDGKILASSSIDRTVRLWDVSSGRCLKIFQGHDKEIRAVAMSPDNQLIASGSFDRTIRFWDINTGKCLKTLQGHTAGIRSLAFSPDSQILASGDHDQSVKLWHIKSGQCLKTFQGYTNWVWSVAFSPYGQTLASSGLDRTVRLWNPETGECIKVLHGHTNNWVWSVAFSPDGHILASCCDDETIRLWDVKTGQCLKVLRGHTNGGVWTVTFNQDEQTLVSGGQDGTIRFWQVSTGQCSNIWQAHTNWIWTVIFSPDGRLLASCSDDQTIKLWDISTGECLKTLQKDSGKVMTIAFSPDGQLLASGNEDLTLKLWNLKTGQCTQILQGHTGHLIKSVTFSSDGQILASSGDDNTIRLWCVSTGQCVAILQEHLNWVVSVAFSPNGQTLVSGSTDGTLKLWNVRKSQCIKTLKVPRPYEEMNITGVKGLTKDTIATLKALGATQGNN